MPHPTDQGGAAQQGWSGSGDEPVAPEDAGYEDAGYAGYAGERAHPDTQEPYPAYGQDPYRWAEESTPYGPPTPAGWPPPTNTKAVIALCTVFAMPILGIVFGVMARREIARTGEAGRAYATWGLGLGIAAVALWVLYLGFIGLIVFGGVAGSFADAGSGF